MFEWLTLWPVCAPFPVNSQRRDMTIPLVAGLLPARPIRARKGKPRTYSNAVPGRQAGPSGPAIGPRRAVPHTRNCLDRAKMTRQVLQSAEQKDQACVTLRYPAWRTIVASAVLAAAIGCQGALAQGRLDAQYAV